jgi:hypothetical protein
LHGQPNAFLVFNVLLKQITRTKKKKIEKENRKRRRKRKRKRKKLLFWIVAF